MGVSKIPWSRCDNVNFLKTSKSYKIQTSFTISDKFNLDPIYNYKEVFDSKFEFRETAIFRKIQNYIKFKRLDGFFPYSIPNVLEHWSLYKRNYSTPSGVRCLHRERNTTSSGIVKRTTTVATQVFCSFPVSSVCKRTVPRGECDTKEEETLIVSILNNNYTNSYYLFLIVELLTVNSNF